MIQTRVLIATGLTNLIKRPMKTDVARKPESVERVKLNHKEKMSAIKSQSPLLPGQVINTKNKQELQTLNQNASM